MQNNWQESEKVEFKESLATKESAGCDLCALANKNGGIIYFGVKDDGTIIGVRDVKESTLRGLSEFYRSVMQPAVYPVVEIINIEERSVIKITVEKSSTPYHTFKNVPYIRVGSSSIKMEQGEYQKRLIMHQSANVDYSASVVSGASLSDLSLLAIQELRRMLMKSRRFSQNIEGITDLEFLRSLQLLQEDSVTVAALVLLGTKEGLYKYFPHAEIRYGYKLDQSELRNQDEAIFNGGYLTFYNELWDKINSRNIILNIPSGLFLEERKAFEDDTIRESINNAVMHRDYRLEGVILVMQYHTLIEINSPGGFVDGVNIENIRMATKTRNKLIGDILYKCDLVEQFGSGVDLMYKNQLSFGKNPPDFSKSDDYTVRLSLDGTINDVEFAKYVFKIADKEQKILSVDELVFLFKIKNKEFVERDKINSLINLGLVEIVGKRKYILSKKYYLDSNQRGKYTRSKGLDGETNKQIILKHLSEFPEGAKKQELIDVLPHLSWIKIWRILDELRNENKIVFIGSRRSKTGFYRLKNEIENV